MPQLEFLCPEDIMSQPKTADGHFCQACFRNVIDFRNFSDDELRHYFLNRTEKTCGIFRPKQIKSPPQSIISSMFRIAFGLVFLLGLNTTNLFGQQADTIQQELVIKNYTEISGVVTSDTEPIAFARVVVYEGDEPIAHAITGPDGNYCVSLDTSFAGHLVTVSFRSIGFTELRFTAVMLTAAGIKLNADLSEAEVYLTGFLIIDTEAHPTIPSDPSGFGKMTITQEDLRYRQR